MCVLHKEKIFVSKMVQSNAARRYEQNRKKILHAFFTENTSLEHISGCPK